MGIFRSRCCSVYFYPRPPRGGRRRPHHHAIYYGLISIHALREEGDDFYINAPDIKFPFLSTPSARRATIRTKSTLRV